MKTKIIEGTKWISVDSLLEFINKSIDEGNLVGEKGFSSALFLSQLIKELKGEVKNK